VRSVEDRERGGRKALLPVYKVLQGYPKPEDRARMRNRLREQTT
jgi:hypothetical protein